MIDVNAGGVIVRAVGILRWGAIGLLGTGVICGSFFALDSYDADAKFRDTFHLLDLLDSAPMPQRISLALHRRLITSETRRDGRCFQGHRA